MIDNSYTPSTNFEAPSPCPHCSNGTSKVYHIGGKCPKVKSVEYYPDGRVKKIEYEKG
jgi:hypothetical protein